MVEQADCHIQKKWTLILTSYHIKEINPKWIKGLNLRAKTTEVLGKKNKTKLSDLGFGKRFLKCEQHSLIFQNMYSKQKYIPFLGLFPMDDFFGRFNPLILITCSMPTVLRFSFNLVAFETTSSSSLGQ